MNVYTLVEGLRVEPYVYAKWIPAINPNLRQVQSLHELRNNNFIIFSGGGYPSYLKMIGNAVARHGSTTMVSPLLNVRICNWQVVVAFCGP